MLTSEPHKFFRNIDDHIENWFLLHQTSYNATIKLAALNISIRFFHFEIKRKISEIVCSLIIYPVSSACFHELLMRPRNEKQ